MIYCRWEELPDAMRTEAVRPYYEALEKKRGQLVLKRAFDAVVSAVGLTVLSPVFLLAAVSVAVSSPGGVFFRQERMGLSGRPFTIYKFRSMRTDNAGLKITTGNDRRITPVGRFLRKSKIDELPQLWNVLKGDMSVVGPRPEVREYTELYRGEQCAIFLLKPGITDRASIEFRNENDLLSASEDPNRTYIEQIMPRKLALSLSYFDHVSLGYDIQLIFKTLLTVLRD